MANTKIISPSALDRFYSCPHKFRLDEFLPKDESTIAQEMGKNKHRILEHFFKGKELSQDDTEQLEVMLTDSFVNEVGFFSDEQTITGVEETFALDYGSYAIHGVKDYVDRVNDRVLIVDWKTGKTFYRKEDVENSMQGKIYALDEFKKNKDVQIVFFRIGMTEYGKVVGVVFYREDMDALETEVKMAIRYYLNCHSLNVYPARPSSRCGQCPHISKCPHNILTANLPMIGQVDTDDLCTNAIKQIQVTQTYLSQLQEMVDSYTKTVIGNEDKVYINDIKVEVKRSSSERVRTSKKAKELLDKYKDQLGIKIDTSITNLRSKLSEEELNKLREIDIVYDVVTEKINYEVMTGDTSDNNTGADEE